MASGHIKTVNTRSHQPTSCWRFALAGLAESIATAEQKAVPAVGKPLVGRMALQMHACLMATRLCEIRGEDLGIDRPLGARSDQRRGKITRNPVPRTEALRRAGDPPALFADSSKAQRELG